MSVWELLYEVAQGPCSRVTSAVPHMLASRQKTRVDHALHGAQKQTCAQCIVSSTGATMYSTIAGKKLMSGAAEGLKHRLLVWFAAADN